MIKLMHRPDITRLLSSHPFGYDHWVARSVTADNRNPREGIETSHVQCSMRAAIILRCREQALDARFAGLPDREL